MYYGMRGWALIFAAVVVGIALLPAKVLFALTGIALCVGGMYLWPTSVAQAFVAFGGGVALLALAVLVWRREQLAEDEEARKAADFAKTMAQERNRPRL